MKNKWQRGVAEIDGIVILCVLIFIVLIAPKDGGNGTFLSSQSGSTLSSGDSSSRDSGSSNNYEVSLGSGNAAYSYQSYEEYITVQNRGKEDLNISGWQLKNGKDGRTYNLGGQLQRFSADIALIPQGAVVLSPTGNSITQDIVLKSGEKAIITTGSVGVKSPYVITSFKENMCTGYIEALPDYAFTPALGRSCPRPVDEPGLSSQDSECKDFVKKLSSCEVPEFGSRNRDGEYCADCINGVRLSNSCSSFIKQHFSYKGCVANHSGDEDFSGKTWRIFLGRGWEMWAENYETIELFDRNGMLTSFRNY